MNTQTIPFSGLTPDTILTAVDSVGLLSDGRLLALNSYENRVYQVGIENAAPIIVKFYRPERWSDAAILEEHAFLAELADSELPITRALSFDGHTLFYCAGFRFALFPKQSGRVPEIQDYETFEWLGRLIGRLHAVGALRAYQARPTLSIENFGVEPSSYLLEHNIIPPELVDAYQTTVNQALAQIQRCYQQAGDSQYLRLHGDCYPGNMLWHDDGPHFVDFDDSRMGPAVQDLWLILNGSRQERLLQLDALLQGYTTFYDFDHRELYLIEALRTLRLIHYSAWLARRWNDPAFPNAFPWFNTLDYWQKRIEELAEQIELMQEQPLMTMIAP